MSKVTEQQIREMAKLSLASNRISEVQEKNLKMYPLIFFDSVKKAEIDYDFTNNQTVETEEDRKNLEIKYKFNKLDTKHFRVSYYLTVEDTLTGFTAQNEHMDKRFKALEDSVRNLFWKETKVEVFINGVKQYESKDV